MFSGLVKRQNNAFSGRKKFGILSGDSLQIFKTCSINRRAHGVFHDGQGLNQRHCGALGSLGGDAVRHLPSCATASGKRS
jgi:hypothetical protein